VVFHLIGALSEFGKVGVVCAGGTAERAGRLYEEAIAVLDRECGGEDRRGIAPTPGGGDG
jgi:hypothetical protein